MNRTHPVVQPRLFSFVGNDRGPWTVVSAQCLVGAPLSQARFLRVLAGAADVTTPSTAWALAGISSNEHYVERPEKVALAAAGWPGSTRGDVRGPDPDPQIARVVGADAAMRGVPSSRSNRTTSPSACATCPQWPGSCHYCRDLGPNEPFDILTWFDYAPMHESAFDEKLDVRRSAPEWGFVDREVDIRVVRARA